MSGEPDDGRRGAPGAPRTGPGWADTVQSPQLPADTPPPGYGQPPSSQPPNSWPPAAPAPGPWSPPAAQAPNPWSPPAEPAQAPWPAGPGGPGGPGQWPPAPAPQQAPWPAAAPARPRSRRGLLVAGEVAAGVIVLYLLVAAVAQVFPFSPNPDPDPAPVPVAAGSSPASANPGPANTVPSAAPSTVRAHGQLAAGVKPLKDVMPYDLDDLTTECTEQAKIPWTNPGLVTALECDAPDVPDGQVFGYQLDSDADYQKAWANYNTWAEFGTSDALDCPPGAGSSQGGPGEWWGPRYAKHAGQVLECFTSDSGPVYIWTYPTQDAFIVAQPPKSWTFSKLETWWEANAV